jgi:hypothetical protein
MLNGQYVTFVDQEPGGELVSPDHPDRSKSACRVGLHADAIVVIEDCGD